VRSVAGCCSGVLAVATIALSGCEFSDVVEIGSDRAGSGPVSRGGGRGLPPSGTSGSGGTATDGGGAGTEPVDSCGVGFRSGDLWVQPTTAADAPAPGSGGPFELGEYRLRGLRAHDATNCLQLQGALAQTLLLREDWTGSVVSDYFDTGPPFVTTFTYQIENNAIRITPTCSDPAGPVKSPFGPFETYTAVQGGLSLVSAECGYQADYQFMLIPAR
jgi:hypothetical protein